MGGFKKSRLIKIQNEKGIYSLKLIACSMNDTVSKAVHNVLDKKLAVLFFFINVFTSDILLYYLEVSKLLGSGILCWLSLSLETWYSWVEPSGKMKVLVLVAQSCLTLCDPMGCRPPDSSVHGILQARILVVCHSLLQAIFLTQGSNWGFLGYCCCSVTQLCLAVCDPMGWSTPGFPVLHLLLELAQTHVHWVSDVIQPSCPLSPPSPPAGLQTDSLLDIWATRKALEPRNISIF